MILSLKDIEHIKNVGFKEEEFCFKDEDGYHKLKNVDDVCFFLKNNKCTIYDHRPRGCKFYPIVFDIDRNKPALDEDCPLIDKISDKIVKSFEKDLLKFVRVIKKEKTSNI